MQKDEIIQKLKGYLINDVLENEDTNLTIDTPLLEWGIINSFEMVRLLSYIQSEFGLDIPPDEMIADHFKDIATIANLIWSHAVYPAQ